MAKITKNKIWFVSFFFCYLIMYFSSVHNNFSACPSIVTNFRQSEIKIEDISSFRFNEYEIVNFCKIRNSEIRNLEFLCFWNFRRCDISHHSQILTILIYFSVDIKCISTSSCSKFVSYYFSDSRKIGLSTFKRSLIYIKNSKFWPLSTFTVSNFDPDPKLHI